MVSAVCLFLSLVGQPTSPVILVEGAGGTAEYTKQFSEWGDTWQQAGEAGGHAVTRLLPSDNQKQQLLEKIEALPPSPQQTSWLILIGHGTFDGRTSRFNMQGPDLTPDELKAVLEKRPAEEEWVIIQAAAASGPFLAPLSGPNRIVLTATRSGDELSVARLGGILATSLQDPDADLDQDEQVSLLEAFVSSGLRVTEFYESEGRLVTEHALLDDNGDQKGTPQDWFQGLRLAKKAVGGATADGVRAKQIHLIPSPWEALRSPEWRNQRDLLERQLQDLKTRQPDFAPEDYRSQLRKIIEQLATLYRETRAEERSTTDN